MLQVVSKCLLPLVLAAFAFPEVPATALGQAPGSLEATAASYVDRGNSSFAKGEMDRAIVDFNLALEFNPRYADAFYNRGRRGAGREIGRLPWQTSTGQSNCSRASPRPMWVGAESDSGKAIWTAC